MRAITRLAAAALAGGLVLGAPATALAQETTRTTLQARDDRIETVKARAQEAIRRRLAAIDAALARLAADPAVSDEHEAALTADLREVADGLTALSARIAAETDPTALRALVADIVEDFHVFAFQLPRVRLVVASDKALAVATRLDGVAERLQAGIDRAEAAGRDVDEAEAALRDMRQHLTTGRNRARAAGDKAMALNHEGFPGNRAVLVEAREDLAEAREDLAAARRDAAKVVAALRSTR